ncbi:hypothetical protein [Kineosporia babensis]|uniref:Uncharacterized protein n=1 Tax=Kineosporia babensis TaxID=499548 RepID=A0A9X1NQE6_9ACTN|nr:hypothetical protein [Kineosporia babensis]MCD5317283.1 hypothetical protein [Kineosporia babensis]
MTSSTEATSETSEAEHHPWRRLLAVLGNITALTALLFYFGWRRSEAQADALGLSQSILGQGTQDYLLRSINTLLPAILGIALTGLLWLWADPRITARLYAWSAKTQRRWLLALSLGWIALPAAAFAIGILIPTPATVFFPLSIGTGFLFTAYSAGLRRRLADHHERTWADDVFHVCIAVIVCLTLFWAAANYAQILGKHLAAAVNDNPSQLVPVVVFSEKQLYLTAPGVGVTELPQTSGEPTYRYDGLRLLQHVGDRYFLISDGWSQSVGEMIELKDEDSVRLQFSRLHR